MPNENEVHELISTADSLAAIDQLEDRAAQSFINMQKGLINILNQYAEQSAVVFELAREPFGHVLSEAAAAYKEAMQKETDAINAALEAAKE